MPSNHLILCHPLLLLPSIFPSIRVFSNESALHISWPKFWSFSLNISLSKEHSGPISFRMDWLDLLVVQGTLKSLLQHHSSKASILWHSCMAQLVKNPPAMWETWVQSLGWEDPLDEGNGNPLQYSCLENPMDRGAWWAILHRVAKSWTQLSNFTLC